MPSHDGGTLGRRDNSLPRSIRKTSDLPQAIPVFPLGGVLLLPGATLPLNIFEPRYLAMVDGALAGERLIGMIQPAGLVQERTEPDDKPVLAGVGCAGRITAFQETDDGRYLIVLTGVCRFQVAQELPSVAPYRIVRAGWTPFAGDLRADVPISDAARSRLVEALRIYLARSGMSVDWEQIETSPVGALVNSLAAGCPFTAPEKQALLEAQTLTDRCDALIALLSMERPGQGGGYVQ